MTSYLPAFWNSILQRVCNYNKKFIVSNPFSLFTIEFSSLIHKSTKISALHLATGHILWKFAIKTHQNQNEHKTTFFSLPKHAKIQFLLPCVEKILDSNFIKSPRYLSLLLFCQKKVYTHLFIVWKISKSIFVYYLFTVIDCALSEWGPWSECDAKCGTGMMSRTRSILRAPENGGNAYLTLKIHKSCS